MGCSSWKSSDWGTYTKKYDIKDTSTVKDLYVSKSIDNYLDPSDGKIRESRDSEINPNSNAIIVGLDVTGSMGYLAQEIAKVALNTLITDIYTNNAIDNPHVMIGAIGDMECDSSPLQVTQFEADIELAEQLRKIYFEGGGGGNSGESYLGLWYFAARHTSIDCFEKRNKKGFIFTIGDEPDLKIMRKEDIKKFFGDDVQGDITEKDMYNEVSKMYEVFHIVTGNYQRRGSVEEWTGILGDRCIIAQDYKKIPEIIESILEVMRGKTVDEVVEKYTDSSTALIVRDAISGLKNVNSESSSELVEF